MTELRSLSIFGIQLPIRTLQDDEFIREVVHYVESNMTQVSKDHGDQTPAKIALMAALNIAAELLSCRQEQDLIEEKLDQLCAEVNQSLQTVENGNSLKGVETLDDK
jgi:cell division protein ZapA (FtsZ GTPase activity inhibitor)